MHKPLLLDTSNPLEASIARLRAERFEIIGPDKSGYAIREIESREYVLDAIDNVLDAREHVFRANGSVALNLYVELETGGFNETHATLADGVEAFDKLIAMYPSAYARLHWLDDHNLIVREHDPVR